MSDKTNRSKKKRSRGCLFKGCAGVVLLALLVGGGGLWFLNRHLSAIARRVTIDLGGRATGVAVRLDGVSVDPFGGSASLEGFELGNPEGYTTPHSLRIEEADLALDLRSLAGTRIVVHRLGARGIDLHAETGPGGSNLSRILENVRAFAAGASSGKSPSSGGGPEALSVGDLQFQTIRLAFTNAASDHAGPAMSVESLRASLDSADAIETTVETIAVGNPGGFSENNAAEIGRVVLVLDAPSLLSETLVIRELRVEGVTGIYETGLGTSNISAIQQYVTEFAETLSGRSGDEPGQAVRIERFDLVDAKGTLSPKLLQGKGMTMNLKDIHLENIESENMAGALREILAQVAPQFESVGGKLAETVLGTVGELGKGAVQGVGEVGKGVVGGAAEVGTGLKEAVQEGNPLEAVKGVGKGIGSVGEGVVGGAAEVGKGVGGGVKKLGEGVGRLLPFGRRSEETPETETQTQAQEEAAPAE